MGYRNYAMLPQGIYFHTHGFAEDGSGEVVSVLTDSDTGFKVILPLITTEKDMSWKCDVCGVRNEMRITQDGYCCPKCGNKFEVVYYDNSPEATTKHEREFRLKLDEIRHKLERKNDEVTDG